MENQDKVPERPPTEEERKRIIKEITGGTVITIRGVYPGIPPKRP